MIILPAAIEQLQQDRPALLIFLRHFGCTFCRAALADVAQHRRAIQAAGVQIAFVHMSPAREADPWFEHYGVADLTRISDPDKALYRTFGLEQASLGELVHPRIWWPWLHTAVINRHGIGTAGPNWRQLTGVFVLHRGHLLAAIRHANAASRPDYVALVHGLRLRAVV